MSDNKKIGFDILESSDMTTIEKIGTGKMNIDRNARDRMLNISMRKYEAEKEQLDITQTSLSENNEMADSVTGVETYDRKKLPQIIYIALCSAAAVSLTVGSIALLSRQKNITPDIKNPIAEVTTTVTGTTASNAAKSDTSAYVTATATGTEKSAAKTTSGSTSVMTTTTTAATTVATESVNEQKLSDTAVSAPYTNPHTDRTDITREELEAAAVRAIRTILNGKSKYNNPYVQNNDPSFELETRYAFYDVNDDSVPELFIITPYILGEEYMCVYDGKEYVSAYFNGHDKDGNEKVHEVVLNGIDVFTEKNTIGMSGHQGGDQSFIIRMGPDNTITPLHEYTYCRYYKDGRLTEEYPPDDDLLKFKYFCEEYAAYERTELNWTVYRDINNED